MHAFRWHGDIERGTLRIIDLSGMQFSSPLPACTLLLWSATKSSRKKAIEINFSCKKDKKAHFLCLFGFFLSFSSLFHLLKDGKYLSRGSGKIQSDWRRLVNDPFLLCLCPLLPGHEFCSSVSFYNQKTHYGIILLATTRCATSISFIVSSHFPFDFRFPSYPNFNFFFFEFFEYVV